MNYEHLEKYLIMKNAHLYDVSRYRAGDESIGSVEQADRHPLLRFAGRTG